MLPEQQAPLILTAMTLRGIGSYLHGARLEIKPLTILCGKNGSGKSTWLKALNVLRRALDQSLFPFSLHENQEIDDLKFTNAFYYYSFAEDHARISDEEITRQYGPPGTIGLEMQATRDLALAADAGQRDPENEAQDFLWNGGVSRGMRICLRVAQPNYVSPSDDTLDLQQLIELDIDARYRLQLLSNREEEHYLLSCSSAFVPGVTWSEVHLLPIATILRPADPRCEPLHPDVSPARAGLLLQNFVRRLEQLLRQVLDGYFYIGAIRPPAKLRDPDELASGNAKEGTGRGDHQRRHVGAEGQEAWHAEYAFGASIMQQEHVQESGGAAEPRLSSTYSYDDYLSAWLSQLTDVSVDSGGEVFFGLSGPAGMASKPPDSPTGLILTPESPRERLPDKDLAHQFSVLTHPCFGGERQPPEQFSAGFHQVFPIIAQLGLMRSGELVGIENPEVHLHPALQLKLVEAFIAHARSGRRMIIETHSDLVVRRAMRAILAEEMTQEEIQIYFTQLDQKAEQRQGATVVFRSSTVRPLGLDAQDRIKWPEGFLDDDVRESQRLLDIMYGGTERGDEDD